MHQNIERTLLSQDHIDSRITELSGQINQDYAGQELMVVMLLKGAMIFTADICRHLDMPVQIECLKVSSYHGGTESSGTVEFLDSRLPDFTGKHVLLVDDILDTGRTLAAVCKKLQSQGVSSLKTCVLLSKKKERAESVDAHYIGFEIRDEFVVGYGLDYQGLYRNLPYIGILAPHAI